MKNYTYKSYVNPQESYENGVKRIFDRNAIDTIETGTLSKNQISYLNSVFDSMIQEGYFVTKSDKQIMGKDIRDVDRWYSHEPNFRVRVRNRVKLYKASHERHSPQNVGDAPEGNQCPSMQCMFDRCKESRGRPYTHHVRFWDKHSEAFNYIWPNMRQYLKEGYHSELWERRNKAYGLYLCSAHMSQIMARFNKSSQRMQQFYKAHWAKKRHQAIKTFILFQIMLDNDEYYDVVFEYVKLIIGDN